MKKHPNTLLKHLKFPQIHFPNSRDFSIFWHTSVPIQKKNKSLYGKELLKDALLLTNQRIVLEQNVFDFGIKRKLLKFFIFATQQSSQRRKKFTILVSQDILQVKPDGRNQPDKSQGNSV